MEWWRKAWDFIWDDESLLSWFVNLALAFVIIKYIVYPVIGLLFGTQYPIVAVVSASMEHPSGFDTWWQEQQEFYSQYNITREEFKSYPFPHGFNKGDIMVLTGHASINQGDVVVYYANGRYPIIHRVIDKRKNNGEVFVTTKGDNNPKPLQGFTRGGGVVDEYNVSKSDIYGVAVVKIPYLGYVKIWFMQFLRFLLTVV